MPFDPDELPPYDRLPVRSGAPKGSAWGLFGDDDQLGCINLLTADKVRQAARLVKKGTVFALNLPLNLPDPPMFGRQLPEHRLLVVGAGMARDDCIDSFWPQGSSQWDGLRHVRHPRDGFYNGVEDSDITLERGSKLGIENWARRGIVGRGVLLDVERYLRDIGQPLDQRSSTIVHKETLEACAKAQNLQLRPADILVIRVGWLRWYLDEATPEERRGIGDDATVTALTSPGIGPVDEMAEYLWNLHVAAVACDNPAVEPWPPGPGGFLHFRLLPHFGMPIGELWYLEDLAAACAEDGVYEFMLTSAPLNIPGGVGSPPNALAIK